MFRNLFIYNDSTTLPDGKIVFRDITLQKAFPYNTLMTRDFYIVLDGDTIYITDGEHETKHITVQDWVEYDGLCRTETQVNVPYLSAYLSGR